MAEADPASPTAASGRAHGRAERLLHRLALGSRWAMETSFDLECARFGRAARALPVDRPIFVCGLARAGTSLVVRLIAAAPATASPTYRDMPFPLAPNLWDRLSGSGRKVAATPRGHGDGLAHDLDTPEAIEEALWLCFEGPRYRRGDALVPARPERETIDALRRYISLVLLRGGGRRYVSKNNNNVLRSNALAEAFPDALFVHPFRHPAAQAASLARQHERACALQRRDPFRLHYARSLGHHEFGLERRPYRLGAGPGTGEDWLGQYDAVYRHLLDQPAQERRFFLDHDALRASPTSVLSALCAFLGLALGDGAEIRVGPAARSAPPAAVKETYQRLLARSAASTRLA